MRMYDDEAIVNVDVIGLGGLSFLYKPNWIIQLVSLSLSSSYMMTRRTVVFFGGVTFICSIFLWVEVQGAGFKYRADPRTGAKRLALNLPGGGSPIILTDFDEKPYFGPRNLVDVNRPRDVDNRRQRERDNLVDDTRRPNEREELEDDNNKGAIENFIDVSNLDDGDDRPATNNNNQKDRTNDKLVRPGGGYPSEDVDNDILQQQRRPPQRPTRPSRPPQKGPSYGGSSGDEDGYFYPKPKKPFTLPGETETVTRRPQRPPPQVGYPDVPFEEMNFGFGQNSEENILAGGGRPFSPANPQQQPRQPTRRPTSFGGGGGGQQQPFPSRRPGSTGRPFQQQPTTSRRPGGNAGNFGQPPRNNPPFGGPSIGGNFPSNSQRGQSGNTGGSGGGGTFRPRPPPPADTSRNPFNGVRETVFAGANRGTAFAGASRETSSNSFQNSNRGQQQRPTVPSSAAPFGGGAGRLPQRPPQSPPPPPPQRRPPPPPPPQTPPSPGGFVMQTNRRVSQSSSSNSSFSEESSFTSSNGQRPPGGQGQQNSFSSSGQRGQGGRPTGPPANVFPSGQRGQSSSFGSSSSGGRFPSGSSGQRGQSSSFGSGSSTSSGGGGSYGGFDDNDNFLRPNNIPLQNPRDIVAPNFGPVPSSESEIGNNKDISECGQDGQDEYFSHRLGRCIPRVSRPSAPPTRRPNNPSY